MKRVITVGLIVIVLVSVFLLIWKVLKDEWPVSDGQDSAEFLLNGSDSTAVVTVQPLIPPVIELVDGQHVADESRGGGPLGMKTVMLIDQERPPLDETGSGLVDASVSSLFPEVEDVSEEGAKTVSEEEPVVELEMPPREREKKEGGKVYDQDILSALFQVEKKADSPALKILQTGREMSLENREIVQGGCWNYVDAVYSRSGYPEGKRQVVFSGEQEDGEYAERELIRPGDWLFYINHEYREVRHSAIFIDWLDYEKQRGLMLSYGGEGRGEPARYHAYDLRHVYNIVRPSGE